MDDPFGARVARFERHVSAAQECLENLVDAERAHIESAKRLEEAKRALEGHMARWLPVLAEVEMPHQRRAAVVHILANDRDRVLTNAEIIEALQARGDEAAIGTLNSSVSRILSGLAEQGVILRHGKGKWQCDSRLPAQVVFAATDKRRNSDEQGAAMNRLVDELYDGSGDMYYIAQALVRKIARDGGESLPKSGAGVYHGDRFEEIVFRAIVEMIKSNSGIGVLNCDQGHPAYRLGADGAAGMGDGPEKNQLFKLLQQFSSRCHRQIHDLSTWDRFCRLVVSKR